MSRAQYDQKIVEEKKSEHTFQLDPHVFHFGLETEYILCRERDQKALWYQDLKFQELHLLLTEVPFEGLMKAVDMNFLELESPHKKNMPFIVEGYGVPDEHFVYQDILPKGIEIRTPVRDSIAETLEIQKALYETLTKELKKVGMYLTALSHHPDAYEFKGPQNKRRFDFWQWAMEVMTTYGPDVNISIPSELSAKMDWQDFDAKVNYYAPAMAALSLASPFRNGALWKRQGEQGRSLRTYKRSIMAPAIEYHPDENGRLEFKVFEMSPHLKDYEMYFTLFLGLILSDELKGRASRQSRIYDLGQVALQGLKNEMVQKKLSEMLRFMPRHLSQNSFSEAPLERVEERLMSMQTPADLMIQDFEQGKSIAAILQERSVMM